MLTNVTFLKGLAIQATDGELGTVDQFYFDDETWAIRYLTVETGGWLGGRQVLISPFSILHVDWPAKRLNVALTKKQVEASPDINTHQPVSRQHEAEYNRYYGYPYYWGGPGPAFYPSGLAVLTLPRRRWRVVSAMSRRIRISAALKASAAITWKRMTGKSAMWTGSSWTMKLGLSATLRWQRGTGCPARRYWFHPRGLNGSVGPNLKCTSHFPGKSSKARRSTSCPGRLLEIMKIASIYTTASRLTGYTKLNTNRRFH